MTLDTAYKDTIHRQRRPGSRDVLLSVVLQQVGTAAAGSLHRLRLPPARDLCVVAREQDLGNRVTFEERRPGEMRVLDQVLGEGFVLGESSDPRTPVTSRLTASISTMAGSSPPLRM